MNKDECEDLEIDDVKKMKGKGSRKFSPLQWQNCT